MNKQFKEEFASIQVSKDLEKKIFDKTINKQEGKKKIPKFSYACFGLAFLCILSLSLVSAKEIKKVFQYWSSEVKFENGEKTTIVENAIFKEIPASAKKSPQEKDSNGLELTEEEIENTLGFKILGYDDAISKVMLYVTMLNDDNTIGRIDIWHPYFLKQEEKVLSLSISMLNEQADRKYVLAFQEGLDATGGKELEDTYVSDNLGVKVILYASDWDKERLTATFCYDNILYVFIGRNIEKQELKAIIESLHL